MAVSEILPGTGRGTMATQSAWWRGPSTSASLAANPLHPRADARRSPSPCGGGFQQ